MEFSVRSFALVSLMLLVSLSTAYMSGPLVVDARRCDLNLCQKYCSLLGKPGCCAGIAGPCRCTSACPRIMSVPPVVDAKRCDYDLCQKYCSLLGKPACCPGPSGPCRCTAVCPRYVTTEITEEVMIGATDEKPFIEQTVVA